MMWAGSSWQFRRHVVVLVVVLRAEHDGATRVALEVLRPHVREFEAHERVVFHEAEDVVRGSLHEETRRRCCLYENKKT